MGQLQRPEILSEPHDRTGTSFERERMCVRERGPLTDNWLTDVHPPVSIELT